MAGRTVSPGAALLRTSRMFSMPAPIPATPGDFSAATKHHSETATMNFPTHLSVTTPTSSRITGDWGFKRPLPLKTTLRSTIPAVRVKHVDSTEHVTDFVSATDHVVTLKKYQEMNLPISVPPENPTDKFDLNFYPKSVFEEDGDVIAVEPEKAVDLENKRWKFKGPWLAGMSDGDFSKYLQKVVRTRRSEFRAYLKEHLAAKITKEQEIRAREETPENIPEPVNAGDITEAQLTDELRRLREERTELYTLVSRFLDLAPVASEFSVLNLGRMAPGQRRDVPPPSPYGNTGPPITHPSAGLSYLRTRNFQDNHAIYGPQKNHPPAKARVLMPRIASAGNFNPVFGVSGFVSETPYGDNVFNTRNLMSNRMGNQDVDMRLHQFELEKYGGSKMYVQPVWATIVSTGTIRIMASEPQPMNTLIEQESKGEDGAKVYDAHMKRQANLEVPRNSRSYTRPPGRHTLGSSDTYGLGQSDFRQDL
ncbi:mitochondrial ribosomal protein MRP51 [Biscogniauxia marginata]|nr:mitochondrial ribosomal protein MRP51 [Biscogniauxia marginata]